MPKMDIYNGRYYIINKLFLTHLGVWPFDNRNYRKHFFSIFYLMMIFTATGPQIHSIRTSGSNMDRIMENLIYLLVGYCALLKVVTLTLAQKRLRVMFESIVNNWQMIVDEHEKQILRKYSEDGRRLTILWAAIFGSVFLGVIMGPLIAFLFTLGKPKSERSYAYSLNGEYWLENKNDYYLEVWSFESLLTYIVSYTFVATDTAFIICTEHCIGLFAIVRYRIQILGQSVNKDNSKSNNDLLYREILEIIKLHQKSLEFSELLEGTYTHWFIYVLAFTVWGFPLCCIQMVVNLKNPIQLMRFTGIFICLAVHLLNFCLPGQQLIDVSSSLVHETYANDKWYTTSSLKTRKALLFFLMRCSKPCVVTAGGLIIMNFENFLMILKTAVSYIMVLGSVRKIDII